MLVSPLACNFKDTRRPDGPNTVGRRSSGWDKSANKTVQIPALEAIKSE